MTKNSNDAGNNIDVEKASYDKALRYHSEGKPGKIEIKATKKLLTKENLADAYSPGVAAPCLEISKNKNDVFKYTAKGNLVGVISNGTATLGLGNIGPDACKPVMEGKAVLFKKFADIDCFDIEVDTTDPEKFIEVVRHLGPTFGGINLEDIKSPECFVIEKELKKLMDIPVFHDDQHGTAIITAAGLLNAAHLTGRKLSEMKMVLNGAGAAAIACYDLLEAMGAKRQNMILSDREGVCYEGRPNGMNEWKTARAVKTNLRTLKEAVIGADVFLGLSVKDALSQEMVASMGKSPIIFAMANPDPEIRPERAKEVRDDVIIATGRSDYNNQINNVMGFPYIFRGALDVGATAINMEMKIAATKALAELARKPVPEEVYRAYGKGKKVFGPEYIVPVPFDPRLITTIPVAVAKAAIETGVARKKDLDVRQYKIELASRLSPISSYMSLLYGKITSSPKQRLVLAEGEDEEVIKAAMQLRDEGYCTPILIGRHSKIDPIVTSLGDGYNLDGIEVMNAAIASNLDLYIDNFYQDAQRKGYLLRDCARLVKSSRNVFAASMVAAGDADALITGVTKNYYDSMEDIKKIIPLAQDARLMGYSVIIAQEHNIIIADNIACQLPTSEDLVEITLQTAELAKRMGHKPRVALLSFANFGSSTEQNNCRVQDAVHILDQLDLDFEYDGEMTVEAALNQEMQKLYPFSRLKGPANILIMPGLNSATISTSLLEELSDGVYIGPILDGMKHPVQIAQLGASANDIMQMAAFAIVDSIEAKKQKK